MQIELDLVPALALLITAVGGGAGIGKLVDGVLKLRAGMSARESKRRVDIVRQRDDAIARESRAWELVDEEAKKRRLMQEYGARLRRQLIELGVEPDPEPVLERTITKAQLAELRETENK